MRKLRCDHCNHLEWPGHAWKRDDLTLCSLCWQLRREAKDPLVFEDSGAIRWDRKLMRWVSVDLDIMPTWDPRTRTWVTMYTDKEVAQFIADALRAKGTDDENRVYVDDDVLSNVCIDGWTDLIRVARVLRDKGVIL